MCEHRTSMHGKNMNILLVDNRDIAKYIGQTPRNIDLTYEKQPNKQNHYYCLQLGTLLHLRGITPADFLYFLDAYDSLKSAEVERLRKIEEKYNKIIGFANEQ